MKPLIMIVEDDRDMAQLNARLLTRHGYETIVANSATEARRYLQEAAPDLFVLDIGLPDCDGISLCTELRLQSDAPVLFLTGRSETDDKVEGLNAGGDYYLTKPYDRYELIAVVSSLLRRVEQTKKKLTETSVISRGPLTLKITESRAYVNGRDAELTSKEFAVLLFLVQNEEKELSGEIIYNTVWGTTMNNDANAVRLTISRLKKKLHEESVDEFAIFTKYGGGYTFTVI